MAAAPAIDPARVIADLRELAAAHRPTRAARSGSAGARAGARAREYLGELLAELGLEPETDEAGNLWARLEGRDPKAPALALGSHLDSVPDGGWLDGALGVMAALGVLRAWAGGEPPPVSLVLVDWADEEGARFGRSLFGSSAFAGTLDPADVAGLRDADGRGDRRRAGRERRRARPRAACAPRAARASAPTSSSTSSRGRCWRREGLRAAAVTGCAGVERLRFEFRGQAAHAGTTPMDARRRRGPRRGRGGARDRGGSAGAEGGVATTGELRLEPGIATAVAGRAVLSVDLRHPETEPLARMLEATRAASGEAGARRGCEVAEAPVMRIEPIAFDPGLVAAARTACAAAAGEPASLASGALHDAAEVARVLPAAMVFAPSTGGHQPRPGGGHPRGRPRGRDRGVRCARRAPPRARHLVPPGAGEPPAGHVLARCLQDINIRLTHPVGFWPPNSRLRRPGSGGPKGTFRSPGANRPSAWP